MIVETRDNVVVRLRPRPNDDVNKYFMCDHGRLNYRWMNRQDRVDVPLVRHGATLAAADWEVAIAAAAHDAAGKRAFVLASPDALERGALPARASSRRDRRRRRVPRASRATKRRCPASKISRCAPIAPRTCAAPRCSASRDRDKPLAGLRRGRRARRRRRRARAASTQPTSRKAGGGHRHRHDAAGVGAHSAAVVLPIANFAEEEGTFTNLRGRVQRFLQAKAAPGFARPSWYVLADLLGALGRADQLLAGERRVRRARRGASGVRGHDATTRSGCKGTARVGAARRAGARA